MADQDKERRGPLDTIESVAEAALAVGAGAAFLYRKGTTDALSTGLRRAGKFLNAVRDDVPSLALLGKMDAKQMQQLWNKHVVGPDSTWNKVGQEIGDKVSLDIDNPRSLLNAVLNIFQTSDNPIGLVSEMYDNKMGTELKTRLQNAFAPEDDVLASKIGKFVNDTMSHFRDNPVDELGEYIFDPTISEKHFRNTKVTEDQINIMQQAIKEALEIKERDMKNGSALNEFKPVIDEMMDTIGNTGNLANRYGTSDSRNFFQKVVDGAMNHRLATVDDVIALRDQVDNSSITGAVWDGKEVKLQDVIERLHEMRNNKGEDFGKIVVDNSLFVIERGENSKLVSFSEAEGIKDKVVNEFSDTIFGKLLKTRDMALAAKSPVLEYLGKGKLDAILAANAEDTGKSVISNDYVYILNKTYKINAGHLEHVSAMDDAYLVSGKHGTIPRLIKSIVGDVDRKPYETASSFRRFWDIGLTPQPTKVKEALSFFTKFQDNRWSRNLIDSFFTDNTDLNNLTDEEHRVFMTDFFNRMKDLDKFFSRTTGTLKRDSINKLSNATSGTAHDLIDILKLSDTEMLKSMMRKNPNNLKNPELASLVKKYLTNTKEARDTLSIVSDYKMVMGQTRGVDYIEMMRKEITKEAFLTHLEEHGGHLNSLVTLLNRSGIKGQALSDVNDIVNWTVLQRTSGVYTRSGKTRNLQELSRAYDDVQSLFLGKHAPGRYDANATFIANFRDSMLRMRRDKTSMFQKGFSREEEIVQGNSSGDWMFMKKAISPLDVLKNLNDREKLKAFGKQFVAGRNDKQNITTATLFPYYAVLRLVEPLSEIGLGFSPKSTGSVGDLAWNIMTRRVLPIVGGISALGYMDYRLKAYTGTGLKGAAANTIANMDLTGRRLIDAFGLTERMKEGRELNPMSQYLWGDEYQDYDERKEWYENGYSPVRKGRWWSFGSTSEFRGGKIEYWQPNYLRRAHSDWYDIGVYGSVDEKWKHSLIPTPRHPLSTLNFLADPYWLEHKHYFDRPYPVTGKLFGESYPWSAIGNATIGNLIKPQTRMHQEELQGSIIDIRSIIGDINSSIKAKASNGSGLVRLGPAGSFAPVSLLNDYETTPTGSSIHLGGGGGYGNGVFGIFGGGGKGGPSTDVSGSPSVKSQTGNVDVSGIPLASQLMYFLGRSETLTSMVSQMMPQGIIATVNAQIKYKASARSNITPSMIVADPVFKTKASLVTKDINNQKIKDMISSVGSTKDLIRDAAYSTKELLGAYGFGLDVMFPSKPTYRLATSEAMASYSRRFWDASVGGAGGEFMEIARRFFPHEDHSINRVNPIRNTMPTWLPEQFLTGDPYTKLPKGELRLPGAGYESFYGKGVTRNTVGPSILSKSKEDIVNYMLGRDTNTNSALEEIMGIGTATHAKMEKWLLDTGIAINTEVPLVDKRHGVVGQYDARIRDANSPGGEAILDFKIVGKKTFNAVMSGQAAEAEHVRQVNYYLNMTGLKRGYIFYVNRDDPTQRYIYQFNYNHGLYKDTVNTLESARKQVNKMIARGQASRGDLYTPFARFRILADVAPYSSEYKKWKAIAKANLRDDKQKKEYEDILKRVQLQNKEHEFYPYKFVGAKLTEQHATVDKILGHGRFTVIGNEHIYKLAGIDIAAGRKMEEFVQPGQQVRIKYDADPETRTTADGAINAIVLTQQGNINRKMWQTGAATKTNDDTPAGVYARFTQSQIDKAKVLETIGHLPVPYLHNKFMRINTPLESYKNDEVYGTPYATWEHPIRGFIEPAFQKAWSVSHVQEELGTLAWRLRDMAKASKATPGVKALSNVAFYGLNPGAFAGATIGFAMKLQGGKAVEAGAQIGAMIGMVGFTAANARNPIHNVIEFSLMGHEIAEHLFPGKGTTGAKYGALAGIAVSAVLNPRWDKDRIFGEYIPKATRKKWEIEEYFDRLKYIKYMGLYEKASRKALIHERVSVEGLLHKLDSDTKKREKLKTQLLESKQKISNNYAEGDVVKDKLLADINAKFGELSGPSQMILRAGKYTRAALAYKQAAESTVFGLKDNATWAQILRAVPKTDRDYIVEFAKERNPHKRKEIMKYLNPYERRVLQLAWGEKPDKLKTNAKFFAKHQLPGLFWAGWRPDVDLDNVEMKTIKNEGMLLSDFGFYDSQAKTPEAQAAPSVDMYEETGPAELKKNLLSAMNGAGLVGVNVNIEPSSHPGIQILANITRLTDYKVKQTLNNTLGRIFY